MGDEGQPNRIRVFLRVRPPRKQEIDWIAKGECDHILADARESPNADKTIIIKKSKKRYDFDKVFDENSTQAQVFKDGAVPTLENVFSGYCGAILAYGQTGTGKTHTMQGYDKDPNGPGRGIIPRCADYIFARISKNPDTQFRVYISFVQIYLDKLQDLFKPDAPEISINPETERVELPGIVTHDVTSSDQIMKLFYAGEKHRVTRATKMNETSSRGHAALIVNVEMSPANNDGSAGTRYGKLVLVDLAGYERFAATGITTGIAAEEAKKINASLLALGSVVNALADASAKKQGAQHHIPYRNAKLTRLLKDCLGGTSVTAIICTIGPCDKYNQETAGTLYFGWRAMAVKVDAKIKEMFDPNQYTNNLKAKITEYAERIKTMKAWWSKGKSFNDYVAKYGDPDVGALDGEEDMIMSTLARNNSIRNDMAQGERGAAAAPAAMAAAADLGVSLQVDDDTEETDNAEVRMVKSKWNNELNAHVDQALKQEEELRMKHLQDLEEAKASGIDARTLAILKQEHASELEMMKEQNALLRKEILRQKNKEEVVALLHSASDMNDVRSAANNPNLTQEEKRIAEIVEHLQETSESKDEVLQRMFELICYYERQIENHDANLQAIAAASSGGDYGYQKMLHKAKARQEELQTALFLKDEEIAALRQGGAGRGGGGGDSSGLSALWAQASSVNPARSDIEELQSHALLLKEKFEDACQQIISRGGGTASNVRMEQRGTAATRSTASSGSAGSAGARTGTTRAAPGSAGARPAGSASPPVQRATPAAPAAAEEATMGKKERFWRKFDNLKRK